MGVDTMKEIVGMDFFSIPIFIISYNRVTDLKRCIYRYEQDGYKNLIILDNKSTNEELLSFYKETAYKVIHLPENYGHLAFWNCGLFTDVIANDYYVVTDPDILPDDECPGNYVEFFYNILQDYPDKTKAGFSLKLSDLPDEYPFKWDVIRYESFFYEARIWTDNQKLYDADIDTTFALYAPNPDFKSDTVAFVNAIRTGSPYVAKHLSWYIIPKALTGEQSSYFCKGERYSTAYNETAVNCGRRKLIALLANKQDGDLYDIIKRMADKKFIKKHTNLKALCKSFFFLLYRILFLYR